MLDLMLVLAIFGLFVLSIVIHEFAHGYVAWRCGDPTAKELGRLTLNPLVHLDPVFSLLLPALSYWTLGFPFGAAKPIPVRVGRLRHPVADDIKVTIAGPLSNFAIAIGLALVMLLPIFGDGGAQNGWILVLGMTVYLNLLLGLFNLLPIPPLDGSFILAHALPQPIRSAYRSVGSFGMVLLLLILIGVPEASRYLLDGIAAIWSFLGHPVDLMVDIFIRFRGLKDSIFQG